jgi:hypothetical protein
MVDVKPLLSKGTNIVIKAAAIIGSATIILGGYAFYMNNIWVPKVEVLEVNFAKGKAIIAVGNKVIEVYGDAIFSISKLGDWGVKFGSSKHTESYDRLELVKRGMVVEYLKKNEI